MYRRVNLLSSVYVLLAAFPVAYISSVLVYLVMDARSPATSLLNHGNSEVGVGTYYSPWQGNTCPLLDIVVKPWYGQVVPVSLQT